MDLVCKTCGKSFKCHANLSRHGRIHKDLRVVCRCGLSFSRRDNLNRHQIMSLTCKALENVDDEETPSDTIGQTIPAPNKSTESEGHERDNTAKEVLDILKSDDSSKAIESELRISNTENSSNIGKDAFTQTEQVSDTESVSDNDDMSNTDDLSGDDSDTVRIATKKHKYGQSYKSPEDDRDSLMSIIKNRKNYKKHKVSQSSEGDDNEFPTHSIIKRKKKHRMHRLKTFRKKIEKQRPPIPSNPIRSNEFSQYGCNSVNPSMNIRKLNPIQKDSRFQRILRYPGVGIFGQLCG